MGDRQVPFLQVNNLVGLDTSQSTEILPGHTLILHGMLPLPDKRDRMRWEWTTPLVLGA